MYYNLLKKKRKERKTGLQTDSNLHWSGLLGSVLNGFGLFRPAFKRTKRLLVQSVQIHGLVRMVHKLPIRLTPLVDVHVHIYYLHIG